VDLHSVLRVAPESFEYQVSLDSFEERLNLLAFAVEMGDNKRTKFIKVITSLS
jgi:hypothetical protein